MTFDREYPARRRAKNNCTLLRFYLGVVRWRWILVTKAFPLRYTILVGSK